MVDFHKLPEDQNNEYRYLWRVGKAIEDGSAGMSWEEATPYINKEWREDESQYRTSSAYRKPVQYALNFYHNVFADSECGDISKQMISELKKERIKLRDERTDYQKSVREEARKESFIELIERVIAKEVEPLDYKSSPVIDSDEDLVVCLSDLHAGIQVQNFWNEYDSSILKKRLNKYINEIIEIQKLHGCKVCHVVLGGDNISGWIHQNLRLQNNENVVEQIKIASVYIGEFVDAIRCYFQEVVIHSVSGNHSRISPNKEDHLKGEELDGLIPFYLELLFANNDNVYVDNECIDKTIGVFKTRAGKMFYIVHGDKDTVSNVVKNLTVMVGAKPDGIIMGHRHHNALDSEHKVKVVQCGCVVGTDDYCVDKRISGEPEQCVFVTSANRAVKCLYDIGLE